MKFSLALDSTQIDTFDRCPQKWYYTNQRHLIRRFQRNEGFDKGTVIHGLLDRYYTAKILKHNFNDCQMIALTALDKLSDENRVKLEDKKLIEQRFLVYTMRWMNNDIQPLVAERGFSIPLMDNQYFYFVLEGKIDLIGLTKDEIKVWIDHKSQSRADTLYDHSIQFLTYAFASGINRGIINYFGTQKEVNENTFRREIVYFSKSKLEKWRDRLLTYFFQVTNCILSNQFEKRQSSCDGKYGKCEFTPLCEEEIDSAREGLIQINYMERKPFEPWSLNGE